MRSKAKDFKVTIKPVEHRFLRIIKKKEKFDENFKRIKGIFVLGEVSKKVGNICFFPNILLKRFCICVQNSLILYISTI